MNFYPFIANEGTKESYISTQFECQEHEESSIQEELLLWLDSSVLRLYWDGWNSFFLLFRKRRRNISSWNAQGEAKILKGEGRALLDTIDTCYITSGGFWRSRERRKRASSHPQRGVQTPADSRAISGCPSFLPTSQSYLKRSQLTAVS